MNDKGKTEMSLIGRIISLEALLMLMGLMSLGYGIFGGGESREVNIFFGVMIVVGVVILTFVRKKDWKKHWEQQEELRARLEARRKAEQDDDRK